MQTPLGLVCLRASAWKAMVDLVITGFRRRILTLTKQNIATQSSRVDQFTFVICSVLFSWWYPGYAVFLILLSPSQTP